MVASWQSRKGVRRKMRKEIEQKLTETLASVKDEANGDHEVIYDIIRLPLKQAEA